MDRWTLYNLVDYHYWASHRVCDMAERLDADEFRRPLGGSFGSVQATVAHLIAMELMWLPVLTGERDEFTREDLQADPPLRPEDVPDAAVARRRWREAEERIRSLLLEATTGELERPARIVGREAPRWQVLAQLVTHGAYHRGQVVHMLRQLGREPVQTDLLVYYFLRDRLAAAARAGDLERLARYLDRDPDLVDARTDAGLPLVLLAQYHGRGDAVELLRARGARLDVFAAAALGDAVRLRELLQRRPDLAREHSADGWTPLHLAAHFGRQAAVEVLLAAGAPLNARSRNDLLNTALHAAIAGGSHEVAMRLVEAGAPLDEPDSTGFTPLHHAAHRGDAVLVRRMLERGARTDLRDGQGRTPLQVAEADGHADVADILRRHGRRA